MKCVCLREGGPIYSSRGRFPSNAHMEGDQVPWAATPPRSAPGREPGQVQPTRGVGQPHLAASRPDLLLDGIFFDSYPYPLVHLAWRPRFL